MPRHSACAAAAALSTLLTCGNAGATTLLEFAFEDADGAFVTTPTASADAFTQISLDVAIGTLGEVSGNPGRALLVTGFTEGNTVTLRANLQHGWQLQVTRVGFDQRASASGPTDWSLSLDGSVIASGPTTSGFTSVSQSTDLFLSGGELTLAIGGSGARSAAGTLRIDNLFVEGTARPVPLPAGVALAALPLALLRGRRRSPLRADTAIPATRRAGGSTVQA